MTGDDDDRLEGDKATVRPDEGPPIPALFRWTANKRMDAVLRLLCGEPNWSGQLKLTVDASRNVLRGAFAQFLR